MACKMRMNVLVLVLFSFCNVLEAMAMAMAGVSEGFSHRDSATTLYSSDNYLKCTSLEYVTPRSTEDISSLIKLQTSPGVKIRATRRGFHSSAGFVCAGRRGSSKAEFTPHVDDDSPSSPSITVLMHLMNRVVDVDPDRKRLTVEAGMTLLELVNAAEANAMSVPPGALPVYANLTVGGVILASAHGSGLGAISSLQDLVTGMKWVNGHGEVIVSDQESEEVRALVGGLGLLGIVTEVTLQLQSNSRTIVEVRKGLSDANIVADLIETLRTETPHIITFWRPDFGRYKMVMFTEENEFKGVAPPEFYPNGKFRYLPRVNEDVGKAWGEALKNWEDDDAEESPSADAMNAEICNIANILHNISVIEDGEGSILEHATLPTNSAVEAEDCSPHCFFHVHHMRTFVEDTEFTIKLSQLQDWVTDVKSIVARELSEIRSQTGASTRCLPPGYVWLRFGQGNPNLLSTAGGTEDVVYVQLTHLHTAKLANKLSKQSTIAETLEQLTLCKYRGRPHWGKNHERVFRHPKCKVRDNFDQENINSLLKLQQVHDPLKMFEPELFTHLLDRSGPEYRELCTPHFWCYCELDEHCPRGHACRPSSSFPEFKICKLVHNRQHVEL